MLKLYFYKDITGCTYAGKSKNNPKVCKRKVAGSFRGNKVCNLHYSRLSNWRREGRI